MWRVLSRGPRAGAGLPTAASIIRREYCPPFVEASGLHGLRTIEACPRLVQDVYKTCTKLARGVSETCRWHAPGLQGLRRWGCVRDVYAARVSRVTRQVWDLSETSMGNGARHGTSVRYFPMPMMGLSLMP